MRRPLVFKPPVGYEQAVDGLDRAARCAGRRARAGLRGKRGDGARAFMANA
jgi:hypothetical protein